MPFECPYQFSAFHFGAPGHYVALVKSADVWLLYEDDAVEPVAESTVQQTFGAASDFLVRHGTTLFPIQTELLSRGCSCGIDGVDDDATDLWRCIRPPGGN